MRRFPGLLASSAVVSNLKSTLLCDLEALERYRKPLCPRAARSARDGRAVPERQGRGQPLAQDGRCHANPGRH